MKNYKNKLLLGVHLSISNGFEGLFDEAERLKINVFQFFPGSPVIWKGITLKDRDINLFQERAKRYHFITAHAPYLINLASKDKDLRAKSIKRVLYDLSELKKINVNSYIIHLGSNENLEEGIKNLKTSLREILSKENSIRIVLENSAGKRNDIGKNIYELKEIIDGLADNIAICLDTCHLFASGVDLRDEETLNSFYNELIKSSLADKIMLIHSNDSKYPVGSYKDRHYHIGKGEIGISGFKNLLNHPLFSKLPYILETPKEDNWDEKNLDAMRKIYLKIRRIKAS